VSKPKSLFVTTTKMLL